MSELLLDPRQEILEIIDRESYKYRHVNPYVQFDDSGCLVGCCVNGLVMMHLGWRPSKDKWENTDVSTVKMESTGWQHYANLVSKRYGENTIGDINTINNVSEGWQDAKVKLAEFWKLPPT